MIDNDDEVTTIFFRSHRDEADDIGLLSPERFTWIYWNPEFGAFDVV
jgi:hypothetical protein